MKNSICFGKVAHARQDQSKHHFNLTTTMVHLNLGELSSILKPYWFWSGDSRNIIYLKKSSYYFGKSGDMNEAVKSYIQKKTGDNVNAVYLLTSLCYFGYCFNPISIYFCFSSNVLTYLILEVTNTPWNEKKIYLLPVSHSGFGMYKFQFKKQMHVSPFMDMDYMYDMTLKYTDDEINLSISSTKGDAQHHIASMQLAHKPITSNSLISAFLRNPLLSYKTITLIHWNAFRLWLKGVRVIEHPGRSHD